MTCFSNQLNESAPHLERVSKDEEPKGKPSCFGNSDKVAPRNSDGLIEPNKECVQCEHISDCLKKALQEQGILNPPIRDREPVNRLMGFLRRWSDKKLSSKS